MAKRKKPLEIQVEEAIETPTVAAEAPIDPRYTILVDSLKRLVEASPNFERVKDNPWLYLEWRKQIQRLVQ